MSNNVKLRFLHVCENAFFADDKKLNIIGIFEKILASKFPAMHPIFAITLGLTGKEGVHKIFIEILTPEPDNKTLIEFERELVIKEDGGNANYVIRVVGLVFPKKGKYQIKVKTSRGLIDQNQDNYIILGKEDGE
jgi:hypothetical protein